MGLEFNAQVWECILCLFGLSTKYPQCLIFSKKPVILHTINRNNTLFVSEIWKI